MASLLIECRSANESRTSSPTSIPGRSSMAPSSPMEAWTRWSSGGWWFEPGELARRLSGEGGTTFEPSCVGSCRPTDRERPGKAGLHLTAVRRGFEPGNPGSV